MFNSLEFLISFVCGKVVAIHAFFFPPSFFASWPISTPGDGMSMWPPPFLWLTTTDQCWPGVLRFLSQLACGRRGIGIPEIWGKLTFRPGLCYFTIHDMGRSVSVNRTVWESLLGLRCPKRFAATETTMDAT